MKPPISEKGKVKIRLICHWIDAILWNVQSQKVHKSTLRPLAPLRRGPCVTSGKVHAAPLGLGVEVLSAITRHVRSNVMGPA